MPIKQALFIALFSFLFFTGCFKQSPPADYVARVGNEYLTVNEIKTALSDLPEINQYVIEQYVDEWIREQLIYREALKKHLDRDETIKSDVEKYRRKRIVDTFMNFIYQQNVSVSNDEIRRYYEKNRNSFTRDKEEARILHFVLKDRQTANQIKRLLTNRRSSEKDQMIKQYNGVYSIVKRDELIPELNNPLFSGRALGVVGPIETKFGYHVIQITERFMKGSVRSISDVRDEIIERLSIDKINTFYETYVDSLKKSVLFELDYSKLKEIQYDSKM